MLRSDCLQSGRLKTGSSFPSKVSSRIYSRPGGRWRCTDKFTAVVALQAGRAGLHILVAPVTQGLWQGGNGTAHSVSLPILPDYSPFLEDHLS